MESYKTQITELESKVSSRTKESETFRFELEQTRIKLKIANEERAKDSETLELYQERVRELELQSHQRPSVTSPRTPIATTVREGGLVTEGESMAVLEDEDGLGEELDTVLSGTTMTDLKLQIRRLKRELEAVQKNEVDSSRILVLENLLEDANRMKARYEADYIAEHREKLVLQSAMEDIRSGKSLGDGYDWLRSWWMLSPDPDHSPEAAIALRQRLNETVEEFDELRRKHTELEVNFENQSKELTIAKSDCKPWYPLKFASITLASVTLVNKDQLDILASLRESVNEDKAEIEADLKKIKNQLKDANDKNKMQLEQINVLLLEKVNLQGDSIDVREKMLARERDFRCVSNSCPCGSSDSDTRFSDLKRVIAGKDLPEDVKSQLIALHEEVGMLKEQYKESQDKLSKAKAVCTTLPKDLFPPLIVFLVHQISRQAVQRGTCEKGRRG